MMTQTYLSNKRKKKKDFQEQQGFHVKIGGLQKYCKGQDKGEVIKQLAQVRLEVRYNKHFIKAN